MGLLTISRSNAEEIINSYMGKRLYTNTRITEEEYGTDDPFAKRPIMSQNKTINHVKDIMLYGNTLTIWGTSYDDTVEIDLRNAEFEENGGFLKIKTDVDSYKTLEVTLSLKPFW